MEAGQGNPSAPKAKEHQKSQRHTQCLCQESPNNRELIVITYLKRTWWALTHAGPILAASVSGSPRALLTFFGGPYFPDVLQTLSLLPSSFHLGVPWPPRWKERTDGVHQFRLSLNNVCLGLTGSALTGCWRQPLWWWPVRHQSLSVAEYHFIICLFVLLFVFAGSI